MGDMTDAAALQQKYFVDESALDGPSANGLVAAAGILVIGIGMLPLLGRFPLVQRVLGSAAMWYFGMLATLVAGGFTWLRHPSGSPHLPDVFHELVPQVTAVWLPILGVVDAVVAIDISMGALIAVTLVLVATRRAPWLVFRRLLVVHAAVVMLRCLTVTCTGLPDARPYCHEVTAGPADMKDVTWRRVLATVIMNRLHNITCGDMVFSGHTAACVLMGMTWHTYYKVRAGTFAVNWAKVAMWAWVAATVVLIVVARLHYTLDVLLGVYLSVTMWGTYHRVADDVLLRHRFYSVWFVDALFVYPAVEWIEAPALGEVNSAMIAKLQALAGAADARADNGAAGIGLADGSVGAQDDAVDIAAAALRAVHASAQDFIAWVEKDDAAAPATVAVASSEPAAAAAAAAAAGGRVLLSSRPSGALRYREEPGAPDHASDDEGGAPGGQGGAHSRVPALHTDELVPRATLTFTSSDKVSPSVRQRLAAANGAAPRSRSRSRSRTRTRTRTRSAGRRKPPLLT